MIKARIIKSNSAKAPILAGSLRDMNIQQKSRKEYIHRINRVADYVETHMDEDHSLETLASVAHFSPYHFHRIFKAIVGETIKDYTNRIRLEKAGRMLISSPRDSVTRVAMECGFSSSAVFI